LAERPVDELNEPDEIAEEDLDDEPVAIEEEELEEDEGFEDDDEDEDDTEDETEGAAVSSGEDDDSDEASLDELLAKRSAKKGSEDSEEDIMTLVGSDRDEEAVVEPLPIRAQPIRDRQEFVCSRCRLVKPKVQLADEARGLCRDCV
jgi:hypothetical protein